jgi:hypothetical protein
MLTATLDDATEGLLSTVCAEAWPESSTLEFKRELPAVSPDGRREFIKDVAALANADGGDIVFGVVEVDGRASQVAPIAGESVDSAVRRLQQTLDTGLEPRLPGPQFKSVDVQGGYVLVVRVPASYVGPHSIVNGKDRRFVMRTGTSTSDLTFDQLRAAFDRTATLGELARQFISRRIDMIVRGETPKPLMAESLGVLHFLPIAGLARKQAPDLHRIYEKDFVELRAHDWIGSMTRDYNLEGVVIYPAAAGDKDLCEAYSQVFRNGCIEAVRCVGLHWRARADADPIPVVNPGVVTRFFRERLAVYLDAVRAYGFSGPAVVSFSIVNVRGYTLDSDDAFGRWRRPVIADRDHLLLPETWLDDIGSVAIDEIAKPLLDIIWQAFGLASCPHFDEVSGVYVRPRA